MNPILFLGVKRIRILLYTVFVIILIVTVAATGFYLSEDSIATNLKHRNLAPSLDHYFGTDWLGRDMFSRTLMGLSLSMGVGLTGALASTFIAVVLGMIAATLGKAADELVSWLIDLFLSVPHLVALILIAFSFGGGMKGVVIGIALTHWPSLARIIRAEVLQIRSADYVEISKKLGKSRWWIATRHIFPQIIPQMLVGFLLMFPHAILHEAAVTFLGLGLSPHEPAIGIILSESMKYLSSGYWWLAFLPGICLLFVVRSFDFVGENLQTLFNSNRS